MSIKQTQMPIKLMSSPPSDQTQVSADLSQYQSILGKHATATIAQRIQVLISIFVGRDYVFDPQGDGPDSDIDQRPSLITHCFDCVTFCDAVLAMANCSSLESMYRQHDLVRYINGTKRYFYRHHFIEGTWLAHNREQGVFAGSALHNLESRLISTRTVTLDYPRWMHYQADYLLKKFQYTLNSQSIAVPDIYQAPAQYSIPYISLEAVLNEDGSANNEILSHMPSCGILMLISYPPDTHGTVIPERIRSMGIDLAVTHLGMLTQIGTQWYFTHAQINRQIISEPLDSYLRFLRKHAHHIAGIAIEKIYDGT